MKKISKLTDHPESDGFFVDERMLGYCTFCGTHMSSFSIEERTKDHAPTKSVLMTPLPKNLPTVSACKECNNSFSNDEEYAVAFLSTVLSGTTEPEKQMFPAAKKILQSKPRYQNEFDDRVALSDDGLPVWQPDLTRLEKFFVKNARAHLAYELHETFSHEPEYVMIAPIANFTAEKLRDFITGPEVIGWGEIGSRNFVRQVKGFCEEITDSDLQAGWVVVQDKHYRYQVNGSSIKIIIAEYFAAEVVW